MATKRTKNGDSEKLDKTNIEYVISLLEGEKPITKKHACEILHIAYNTTRLNNIIEKHKEKLTRDKQKRQEKRGKPATQDEIKYAISEYLQGNSIDAISESLYRGPAFVKGILEEYSVPLRSRSYDYFHPEMIPEAAVRNQFKMGEIVYSTRYDSTARIEREVPHKDEKVYCVWLLSEKWQQYAYQPASELASLEHIAELGIQL